MKSGKFVSAFQISVFCFSGGGAGDGNRTRVISLEGWSSTIELRPLFECREDVSAFIRGVNP